MLFERRDGEKWEVGFCHRMSNTRDHAEISRVMEALGVLPEQSTGDQPAQEAKTLPAPVAANAAAGTAPSADVIPAQEEKERPTAKKRWSLVGGAGSARRSLSVRRDDWTRSRSGGRARGEKNVVSEAIAV